MKTSTFSPFVFVSCPIFAIILCNMKNTQKGFTLIELLVVISIISLLTSIILPNLNASRDKARFAAAEQFDANILHGIGDRLVGQWAFNEGAGTALDSSGNNYNGSVFGSPTWISNGGYDGKTGAYSFNGSSYIQTTMPLSLLSQSNWSITAWITANSGSGYAWIIGDSAVPSQTFLIGRQNNSVFINIYGCNNGWGPNVSIFDGKYHHIALIDTNNVLTFYVDAVSKGTYTCSGTPTNPSNMMIGARGSLGEYWTGMIDNVRVYTASLTSLDVQNHYALEKAAHPNLALK